VVPIKFYGGPNSSPSRYSVFDIDKFKTCLVNCNFCSYFYKIVLFVLILIGILSSFIYDSCIFFSKPNVPCIPFILLFTVFKQVFSVFINYFTLHIMHPVRQVVPPTQVHKLIHIGSLSVHCIRLCIRCQVQLAWKNQSFQLDYGLLQFC
jgi:hypothetical protein